MPFIRSNKVLFLLFLLIFAFKSHAQKIKSEDVVAKHLDSIGTAEKRASVKNQIVVGDAMVNFITQKTAPLLGRIVLASAGEKNFLGMKLGSVDYPSERFSYDGKKGKVSFVRAGIRSVLGNFILSNESILQEGLLGGTLSSSWALLDTASKKAKLSLSGTKKIGGKEAYVLNYLPKGGSDIDINLYFDKETFNHIRTEYKRISSAGIGITPDQSSRFNESRLSLVENFSDFRAEFGLTLPHSYRILYTITGQGTTEIEWTFKLNEFAFNQNLAANTFDAEAN